MKTAWVASLALVGGLVVLAANQEVGCIRSESATICTGVAGIGFVIAAGGVLTAGVFSVLREAADPVVARAAMISTLFSLMLVLSDQFVASMVVAAVACVLILSLAWRTQQPASG